ncbi:MAG: ATPase [Chloroflexi bacterium]|nr:ATPase [Chloroflexota bacterium]
MNSAGAAATQPGFAPGQLHSIEDTGLTLQFLTDLALKHIYYGNTMTGRDVAARIRLPYVGIIESVLETLKRDAHIEVRGGTALTSASYTYSVTSKGATRSESIIERSSYSGPAPVSLNAYWKAVEAQTINNVSVNRLSVHDAFRNLVIGERLLNQLGPAINSAQSMFLFGPPGNGKTTLAETASLLLGGAVYIPHAIEYDGQIIKVYDAVFHASLEADDDKVDATDRRWVKSRRPVVIVGGELTMEALDLVYSETSKYYEAPFQLKANGGMFLIDDFGRQQVSPRDLLNRWIVPLEKREDYLNLRTGQEISVPFDQLIIFSTNLEPASLVDEAFLRRIRYKIEVPNPTIEEYEEIFRRECERRGIPYEFSAIEFVLDYYDRRGIEPRCVHPRDLIGQMLDIAEYMEVPPTLSRELIEAACESYFVRL